jgi:anti-sigma regulatory factor (Ser/Thr protein kinase)
MRAPPAAHSAAFYSSTAEFVAGVRAFIDQGLDQAEPVLIAAPGAAIRLLQQQLDGRGEQVSWADLTRTGANPARIIPVIDAFASSHPGRPVRCVTQPLWQARTVEQRRETIRHEALINLAFPDSPVSILCPYDAARLDPGTAATAEQTHPVVIRNETARPSPGYDPAAVLPPECDAPLDPAPGDAAVLAYRDDLPTVRAFTAGQASKAGTAQDRASDLVIAINELAANTYRHTEAGGTLAIWATADELICQVQDTGHITNPLAGRRHPAPAATGGQGMWVAHQLCDLIEIRTSPAGTQIRVHMQLRPASRPTALPRPRHWQPRRQQKPRWHGREANRRR